MTQEEAHDGVANSLREEGARLAEAAQALSSDNSKENVAEFLDALRCHVSAFLRLGMPKEAMATAVMGLLTAFGCRFRPEEHTAVYLELFLFIAISGSMMQQETQDEFELNHLSAIDAELGPLILDSYNHLGGADVLPFNLRGPFEALPQWVNADGTFQGKKITAMMAADILYDVAARLTTMGVIE